MLFALVGCKKPTPPSGIPFDPKVDDITVTSDSVVAQTAYARDLASAKADPAFDSETVPTPLEQYIIEYIAAEIAKGTYAQYLPDIAFTVEISTSSDKFKAVALFIKGAVPQIELFHYKE